MNLARFSFEAMAEAYPPLAREDTGRARINPGEITMLTPDDLHLAPNSSLRNMIERAAGADGDRSKHVLRTAGDMVRAGHSDEEILGIILNEANAISEHIFAQPDPDRVARRAVERVRGDATGSTAGGSGEGDQAQPSGRERPDLKLIAAGSLNGVAVGEREFIISKLAPAGLVTMFTAPGGGGKSHIALGMAASVATGAMAFGLKTTQATAIYFTCEDDDDENHRRLIGVANALNVSLQTIGDRLFTCSLVALRDKGLVRVDLNSNKMSILPLFEVIREHITATGARFVILDNVAHFFEGNENIRAHVAGFIGLLNSLALETGAAIILISHPNKAGDSFSGSTAFQNQVRSHFHLEVNQNDPDARTLKLLKANYARLEEPLRLRWHKGAFRLESTIPPGESSATARERHEEQLFLACLAARNEAERPVSMHATASKSFAPKEFAKLPQAKDMDADQFELAMNRLLDRGVIAQVELEYGKPGSAGHKAIGLKQIMMVEPSDDPF